MMKAGVILNTKALRTRSVVLCWRYSFIGVLRVLVFNYKIGRETEHE